MSDLKLSVNGTEYGGWTTVSVVRSLEQFSPTFGVEFTQSYADGFTPLPIRAGDECVVKLDGKKVIAGYVDDESCDYDANDVTANVSGRAYTGDLVDCSASYAKGQWKNATLLTIAKNLCEPFLNLSASSDQTLEPFPTFSIQEGETVYETLERGARMLGVLLTTKTDGSLFITSVGKTVSNTVIQRGVNVLSGGRESSWKDRFGQYVVTTQAAGKADLFGRQATSQSYRTNDHKENDEVVSRYRMLRIKAEQAFGTADKLKTRALWERNVRAGKAARLHYTLDGWHCAEGLWQPNTLVRVTDDVLEVDSLFLVNSVQLSKSQEGSYSVLEVIDPRALTVEPLTKLKKGKKGKTLFSAGSAPDDAE